LIAASSVMVFSMAYPLQASSRAFLIPASAANANDFGNRMHQAVRRVFTAAITSESSGVAPL
jgi:hypothetical protein